MRNRVVNYTKTGKKVTHGASAYSNHGCRCVICTIGQREKMFRYSRTKGTRPAAEVNAERRGAMQHGSGTMYAGYGCRCDVCVEGTRLRKVEERRKAYARPTPSHVHGTQNGYDNHGCRCERCTAAKRDYQRALKARKTGGS